MEKITLFVILFLTTVIANAQAPNWEWVHDAEISGSGSVTPEASEIDSNGNIYIVGRFVGTVNFGAGTTLVNSTTDVKSFIVKYSPGGEVLWGKTAASPIENSAASITIDNDNNLYVTGRFTNAITFDTVTLENPGEDKIYIVKFNGQGNCIWAKTMQASFMQVGEITADSNNNIYVTGEFGGNSLQLDNAILYNIEPISIDLFFIKLSNNGDVIWAKRQGGTGNEFGDAIITDTQGNIYIMGEFTAPGLSIGGTMLPCETNKVYSLVAKYNSNGSAVWAKSQIKDYGMSSAIKLDSQGNVITLGTFTAPSVLISNTAHTTLGESDVILAKYNNDGVVIWSKQLGGTNVDWSSDLTIDNQDNICVSSVSYSNTFNVSSVSENLTHYGNAVITKLNSNGDFVWTKIFGSGSGIDVRSILYDGEHLVACGGYVSNAYIDNLSFESNSTNFFLARATADTMGLDGVQMQQIGIWPNPSNSVINVNNLEPNSSYVINDITGRIIKKGNMTNSEIDISSFTNGMYIFNCNGLSSKFIKE